MDSIENRHACMVLRDFRGIKPGTLLDLTCEQDKSVFFLSDFIKPSG